MLSLAAIIVLAVGAGILMAVTTVLVYRYLPSQRHRRAVCRAAARAPSAFDDLEKADVPTRKVQVRRGRVVSWHSAINPIKEGIARLHTPKPQSSRPGSVSSVAPTIDLEKQIQSFRRDYARAKELEARNPGAGAQVNGIQALPQLRAPSPTFRPKILSSIDEAENPADMIKESSWATYNGHRRSNHPLSSYLGELTPTLEKEISLAEPQRPAPVKANSSIVVEKARNEPAAEPTRPAPRRAFTEGPQEEDKPPTIVKPLRLDTLNLGSLLASISADGESSQPLSARSALFKSPINELPPVAPKPRKPSKLDLRGSYSQMDYGFPSPPASSTMTSPTSPGMASARDLDRSSSITEILRHGDFMDLESVMSTPTRSSRPASAASRTTTHSRKSRSSIHRVRKRPPPLPINEPVPRLPEHLIESEKRDDSPTVPSPTPSEVASIQSFKQQQRASQRASVKSAASGRRSAMASPAATSPPVFRVPLYAGKPTIVSKPTVVSPKNSMLSPPAEIARRISDSGLVQRNLLPLPLVERPAAQRTQSSTIVELSPPIISDGQVQNLLRSATDRAKTIGRMPGTSPPRRRSPPTRDVILAASKRPIAGRTVSHIQPQTPKRPSLKALQRGVSAPCVHKALPPLPPASPESKPAKVTERQARSSNSSSSSRSSAGLSAHPVSMKPAPKLITNPVTLQTMANRRISPPSARITSPEDISLTSPYVSTRPPIKSRRSGLDRIASAVIDVQSPEAKAAKKAKVISPASLAAKILPPATLAAKLGAPVVSSREVAPSPRNSGGSGSSSVGGGGIGSPPPPPPPVPHAAPRPASPAVSVISAATPAKRRPPKLTTPSRRWETESAVSPLSVDFPTGVKV